MPSLVWIRRSFIGWAIRKTLHLVFRLRYINAKYVRYTLPHNIAISLLPKGEVAEFLFLGSFFERTELALVGTFIKPGMQIIDVGANIGLYSIYGEKLLNENVRIHAFEPSSETHALLCKNLALNNCTYVFPYKIALANKESGFSHLTSDSGYGDAYRYLAPGKDEPGTGGVPAGEEVVPVTSLDYWAKEHAIQKVDFIKLDIEGGEYAFFEGAKNVLTKNKDVVIFFENEKSWCERQNRTQESSFDLLRALGFTIYAWDKKKKTWEDEKSELSSHDMFWACRKKSLLPHL